jgi:hypothetical protein
MNTMPSGSPLGVDGSESRARKRDFYRRYDVLLANWYLLTRRIQQDIESLRQDLHEELACWQPDRPEPNWNAYADRMNTLAESAH